MTDTLEAAERYSELDGLHLFHASASSCSQRVRMMLAEKGLAFESHILSTQQADHASEAYQAMNPMGLVPTLVHDGRAIPDSIDILRYLEEKFPDVPMMPAGVEDRKSADNVLSLTADCQDAIKTLSNELKFGGKDRKSPGEMADFAHRHKNAELVRFHRQFAEGSRAWAARVAKARDTLSDALEGLESLLRRAEFLSGQEWGIADIAWAPNAHRMMHLRIPYAQSPHYLDWYSNARLLGSFKEAILDWEPQLNDLSRSEG